MVGDEDLGMFDILVFKIPSEVLKDLDETKLFVIFIIVNVLRSTQINEYIMLNSKQAILMLPYFLDNKMHFPTKNLVGK